MEEKRKVRFGKVVSDKMDKTVVVAVETPRHHPIYKKTIRRAVKYKAHDEKNQCHIGDMVRIVETRPLSKDKRWRVAEIVTKGEVAEIKPQEITN
jgi:small subunit ribosomal protein S17